MDRPAVALSVVILGRLLLARLLHLCYVGFPQFLEAYPGSRIHATLERLTDYPYFGDYPYLNLTKTECCGWGIAFIVVCLIFIHGSARRLAEFVDTAINPESHHAPTGFLALLVFIARPSDSFPSFPTRLNMGLYPLYMRIVALSTAYLIIKSFLGRNLPDGLGEDFLHKEVNEKEYQTITDYVIFCLILPFFLCQFSLVLHAMFSTIFQDILWPTLAFLSTYAALKALFADLVRLAISLGVFDNVWLGWLYIKDITEHVLGWPVDRSTILYQLAAFVTLQGHGGWNFILCFSCGAVFFMLDNNAW